MVLNGNDDQIIMYYFYYTRLLQWLDQYMRSETLPSRMSEYLRLLTNKEADALSFRTKPWLEIKTLLLLHIVELKVWWSMPVRSNKVISQWLCSSQCMETHIAISPSKCLLQTFLLEAVQESHERSGQLKRNSWTDLKEDIVCYTKKESVKTVSWIQPTCVSLKPIKPFSVPVHILLSK